MYISWKLLPNSPTWNSNSLDNTDHHLGHEDEEESHKVERAVGPAERIIRVRNDLIPQRSRWSAPSGTGLLEGLVDGSEPAHVGTRGEKDEPQEGHAKVGRSSTSTHPRQAADEINSQRGAIHCQRHRRRNESDQNMNVCS